MVLLSLPAKVTCDEEGCTAHLAAKLALNATGGFAFQAAGNSKGWQIGTDKGRYINFCPKHVKAVQTLTIPRVVAAGH